MSPLQARLTHNSHCREACELESFVSDSAIRRELTPNPGAAYTEIVVSSPPLRTERQGHAQPVRDYSARNACMGSTLEARVAGSHTAMRAIAVRMSGADMNTSGSQGLTPKRKVDKR
jgi:hypothetical protein